MNKMIFQTEKYWQGNKTVEMAATIENIKAKYNYKRLILQYKKNKGLGGTLFIS